MGVFDKNGWLTKAFEHVPGANVVVAAVHAGAGNDAEAGRAATKGFTTAAAIAAGAAGTMTGGPAAGVAAGLATGAALTPAADEVHKAIENEKNKNKKG